MNKVILLALLMPFPVLSQITENFESGDISRWTQSPEGRWSIDNVMPISGGSSLHHSYDSPESGCDRIGLPLLNLRPGLGTTTWSFRIKYGYDPSSSNNWVVFIMSNIGPDSFSGSASPDGFAVGVNQNSYNDTIELYKVDQGRFSVLARSRVNWQSDLGPSNSALISISRSQAGSWTMSISVNTEVPIDLSSGEDPELFSPAWFIVSYRYTASRDMLLWFDDLNVSGFFGDGIPPPDPAQPAAGDLIFTEIMAKPEPAVALPGKEYIELLNRSDNNFSLKGLQLCTSSQKYPFPDEVLKAGEYIILCQASDTALFNDFGKTAGFKSFPALTDAGRILAIINSRGDLIDCIEYSSGWYRDELKSDGGWSIELIDSRYPFSQAENWKASVSDRGGTPGTANSVSGENPDHSFYGIENVFPDDSVTLHMRLSETVTDLVDKVSSILIDGTGVKSIKTSDLLLKEFDIVLREPVIAGRIHELSLDASVTDFAGNPMQKSRFKFGVPVAPARGDIQFNELLFNPYPEEPDFIELVNCSGKVLDALDLRLVSVNDETTDTSSIALLSPEHRCILPGDIYAISTDRYKLVERFSAADGSRIFEVQNLPSMPDDNGHLILLNRKLEVIDEVAYSQKMHFPLLKEYEGVSLEKVRPDYSSLVTSNWQSASESSGWATPGARNSVYSENPVDSESIIFSSGKITPDNDGNDDFLVIDFKLEGTGNVVSVWIFDETGIIVKKLTDNMLAGPEASVVWNGTADDETIVGTGIYVLLIRVFDVSGRVRTWKKVCTVIR